MFTNDKSIENIQQLIVELKKYLSLQKKYARLEITEKLTVLLSMLILILIIIILGMVVLFYLSFTLAHVLAPLVGGLVMSFALISLFHLILIIFVITYRKKLIINPMAKFMANLFLENQP